MHAGDSDAAVAEGGAWEVASSAFIPLLEGAVAEYIAKWQERAAPRGTAQQVGRQHRVANGWHEAAKRVWLVPEGGRSMDTHAVNSRNSGPHAVSGHVAGLQAKV